MNGDKHTSTEVLDEELLKEILEDEQSSASEEGRIVRLDPDGDQTDGAGDGPGSTRDR